MFLKTTAGRPGPANATPRRQHSQVLSCAMRVSDTPVPRSLDQAKARAAPGYFSLRTAAGTRLRLSSQAANTDPSVSSANASKRWLSTFGVIGSALANVRPPSLERL